MFEALGVLSSYCVPVALLVIVVFGAFRGVKVYESFVEGAKESFTTATRLIPYLVGMLVAVSALRASGALDLFMIPLNSIMPKFGIPPEVLPIWLLRPISGSGALALLSDVLREHGPDSLIGRIASTIVGSTETTLYVVAVYFGSVGIRRVRYSLVVGLIADVICLFTAVAVCKMSG